MQIMNDWQNNLYLKVKESKLQKLKKEKKKNLL